jgi:hypothetical protein
MVLLSIIIVIIDFVFPSDPPVFFSFRFDLSYAFIISLLATFRPSLSRIVPLCEILVCISRPPSCMIYRMFQKELYSGIPNFCV